MTDVHDIMNEKLKIFNVSERWLKKFHRCRKASERHEEGDIKNFLNTKIC